ncbi:hypothetical protein [Streptomyces sp. NPDC001601]|uniref:hypothetical protein n=1 Tax=Streptomyces sp. NPDC001601 TaxID=3364592 RepID=UPI0036792D79
MRTMPEEAPGGAVVLCRLDSGADAVQLNEARHLVALRGGRLHLPTGGTGEGGTAPFGPGSRYRLVPDITEHDMYVYGPPAMTRAVPAGLRNLRVLRDRRTPRSSVWPESEGARRLRPWAIRNKAA